jgi:phosphatidylserine/phosphatidylglycerophosphate/cardiolipin synthase-like enzyme
MNRMLAPRFILICFCLLSVEAELSEERYLFYPGSLVVLPQDGREVYYEAFAAAQCEIRIEICVLEDPLILQSLMDAILRGIKVKVIVDKGKYDTDPMEQANLAEYVTSVGGELHLSNPIFPRSFPKVILIDQTAVLIGTACLDTETFMQYRDYVYVSDDANIIESLSALFENDWFYSVPPGFPYPTFNPTPVIRPPNLIISPVNASFQLVSLFQMARFSLDVSSELLGNPTLESELMAAVARGVEVRLISPQFVNSATPAEQALQILSLNQLKAAGVIVHVTLPPESAQYPYMHARTAIVDKKIGYLGSISLSPNSITFNREAGLYLNTKHFVDKLHAHFENDFLNKSTLY